MKEISKEDNERIEKEARLAVLKIARKEGFNEGIEAALNEYHEWINPVIWKQKMEKLKKPI